MKTPANNEAHEGSEWAGTEVDFQLQMEMLRQPLPPRVVDRPCALGDGIDVLSADRWRSCEADWLQASPAAEDVALFVPASGAATRMFQDFNPPLAPEVEARLARDWAKLPFAGGSDWREEWLGLWRDGGWATLPKGMVPFFRDSDGRRWDAMEAHFAEWRFAAQDSPPGRLVFTVPSSFQIDLKMRWEARGASVAFEVQHPDTDTFAWDLEAEDWFRDEAGNPVRRPGGHGALLRNLDGQAARWVFIRNIDNVLPPWHPRWPERISLRAGLAGCLKRWVDERDALWRAWSVGEPDAVDRIRDWLGEAGSGLPAAPGAEELRLALNRPMRVAAVVPNAGQPGGGPFWVEDGAGQLRPGIVESAELPDGLQGKGTHFNPVEMVCYLAGLDGERLPLKDFADASAYFTAEKRIGGKRVRILERPGLWNGGMAGWLTRFVEVPAWSFAPVKTAWDLMNFKSL